jgi:hypothetical protein
VEIVWACTVPAMNRREADEQISFTIIVALLAALPEVAQSLIAYDFALWI